MEEIEKRDGKQREKENVASWLQMHLKVEKEMETVIYRKEGRQRSTYQKQELTKQL